MFWSIGSCMEANRYLNYQNYTEKCCLSPGEHIVSCRDFFMDQNGDVGNGWEGSYIEIEGNYLCKDYSQGRLKEESIVIGKFIFSQFLIRIIF